MNKVIRKEMLAGDLPEDLRGDIDPAQPVTVVVQERDQETTGQELGHFSRFRHLQRKTFENEEAVVGWVRSLRDEWD